MDHPEDLHTVRAWAVEYEHLFEPGRTEDSQGFETRDLEPAMPSHFGLCGEERKRLVGGQEKRVANLGAGLRGKVKGVVVEVLIGLGPNGIACAHRGLFRRSSKRWCLLSQ